MLDAQLASRVTQDGTVVVVLPHGRCRRRSRRRRRRNCCCWPHIPHCSMGGADVGVLRGSRGGHAATLGTQGASSSCTCRATGARGGSGWRLGAGTSSAAATTPTAAAAPGIITRPAITTTITITIILTIAAASTAAATSTTRGGTQTAK